MNTVNKIIPNSTTSLMHSKCWIFTRELNCSLHYYNINVVKDHRNKK